MNVLRSPTGSDTNFERSGSQPNLSDMPSASVSEPSTITFRNKRKHIDGEYDQVHGQLFDIQKKMTEMMTLLASSINAQKESANEIRSDIAMIRCEIQDIRDDMRSTKQQITDLATNQSSIQDEIQSLKNFAHHAGDKIVSLESHVENIKIQPNDTPLKPSYEEILAELNDQNMRKKNILIAGIPEPQSTDAKERATLDKNKIIEIIKTSLNDCPEPKRNVRIGRYKPGTNRPIKVTFDSEEIVKQIQRHKGTIKDSEIKIFADQTPFQQNQLKHLKEELKHRTEQGEENLRIKYIKNVPKIVKTFPKKSNA